MIKETLRKNLGKFLEVQRTRREGILLTHESSPEKGSSYNCRNVEFHKLQCTLKIIIFPRIAVISATKVCKNICTDNYKNGNANENDQMIYI